ncbi:MAG: hypothetical protein ACON35_02895 [Candidatus Marinamargulisbacteria bacterium]
MIDQDQNEDPIKRIINPKSGFSLFIRKSNDSGAISQISTEESFRPFDLDAFQEQQKSEKINEELQQLKETNSALITQLNHTNQKLDAQFKFFRTIALIGLGILTLSVLL